MESRSEEIKNRLFKKLFSNLHHSVACQIIDAALSAEVDKIFNEMSEEEKEELLKDND